MAMYARVKTLLICHQQQDDRNSVAKLLFINTLIVNTLIIINTSVVKQKGGMVHRDCAEVRGKLRELLLILQLKSIQYKAIHTIYIMTRYSNAIISSRNISLLRANFHSSETRE